jgi:NADH dehydrogenase
MKRLVILGGGFAGVWAARGALSTLRRHASRASDVNITLVSRDAWLTIRPRLYEASLDDVRVPLEDVLESAVERIEGEVTRIDSSARTITIADATSVGTLPYDCLILAAGSHVQRPPIPGIEHANTVDTYADALALQRHLATLPEARAIPVRDGQFTAVIVGAGFTGIEVATSLVSRLRAIAATVGAGERARVVVVEQALAVAPDLGPAARQPIEQALAALGIEVRVGVSLSEIRRDGVTLGNGESIAASTTVWTGGLRANRLAAQLPAERDGAGRVAVDEFLRVRGLANVYAAGDVARAMADQTHVAPMSCEYAIPMGERAGSNAVADLLGVPAAPFAQPYYVNCLDLGEAGGLFTQGWDRDVRLTGFWAKTLKEAINTRLIYPPRVETPPRAEAA